MTDFFQGGFVIDVKNWDDDSGRPIGSIPSGQSYLISNFVSPIFMYIAPSREQLSGFYVKDAMLQESISMFYMRFRYGFIASNRT